TYGHASNGPKRESHEPDGRPSDFPKRSIFRRPKKINKSCLFRASRAPHERTVSLAPSRVLAPATQPLPPLPPHPPQRLLRESHPNHPTSPPGSDKAAPAAEMDRYQRVERPRPESAIEENEIRITAQGLIRNYVSYATSLLQVRPFSDPDLPAASVGLMDGVGSYVRFLCDCADSNRRVCGRGMGARSWWSLRLIELRIFLSFYSSLPFTFINQDRKIKEIVLKAMGQAISKSVAVAEIIKKRIPGLHQDTNISSVSITDVWEPIEEGLVPLEMTRHVSMISITLSPEELDQNTPGYQAPAYDEQPRQQQRLQQAPPQRQPRRPQGHIQQYDYEGLIIVAWQIPMLGVEVEGAVDVEGVGVEEAMVVMVDMETTKGATTKAVDTMIIKVDMADMIIKAGMVVVDMATTKADMETTKKMVDIAEAEVVCVEEETIITVVATKEVGVDMEAGAAMKEAGAAMKEAGEGIEEAGEAMKVAGAAMREAGMGMKEAGAAGILAEGGTVAAEGEEWVAVGKGTETGAKSMGFWIWCFL
ncbi:hypothetical protein EJB05_04658, partial [Eragrostis curvula]